MLGMLATVAFLATFFPATNAVAADSRATSVSDHLRTGFALLGRHAQIECQECHVQGVFKGTPRQCQLCHTQGSRTATTFKPVNHVITTQPCELCHVSTVTWTGARFQHVGVAPGSCMTCHNGSTASGKPSNHPITTASCDSCHRTTAWLPAGFNHLGVVPGTCISCHNGSTATGKPSNHIVTSASCDACHRTTAWIPASFSHTTVAPGTCITCHNGTTATGKSGTHFITTRSCDGCHTTTAWTPIRYTHLSSAYSAHNAGVTCTGCHKTNNEVISWQYGAYAPYCAGCHAGRYKQDSHKKTESPTTVFYTVEELKNCAGSCHLYTNNTFTTIKTTRNSKHRSTDGGF